MSTTYAKLGDVAPAKAAKEKSNGNTLAWQLNLDQIESNTGRVIEEVKLPVSEAGNSTHWFDEGNVLFSKLRPYLNKVVVPEKPGIATTELVPLRPDPKCLDRRYLAYYLRSDRFLKWVNIQVAGAKMPRVSMKVFWDHEIPLPPLPEQRRIAAILDKADAIRRKRQETICLTEEFLRSVFLDMFGDPVTNPKGWEVKTIGETGSSVQIGPFGSLLHKEDYVSDGIPLINPKHIVNGEIVVGKEESITEEKAEELGNYLLQVNDIIMGRRGEMGRCAMVASEHTGMLCGTGSLYIRPNLEEITPLYLSKVISSPTMKAYLEKIAWGATMPNLNQGMIRSLSVPMPPISLQRKFSAFADAIKTQMNRQGSQQTEMVILFYSLVQRAFRGDL